MKYLTKVVETYRIDNEAAVEKFIKELKQDTKFILGKYSSQLKERKSKGEVIDSWYHVEVTKIFNEEKEPNAFVDVQYEVEMAYIPPVNEFEEEE